MAETSRYAFPLLQAGQAQKEVTHNSALAQLDVLLNLAVESRTALAPPEAPVEGTAWLVPSGGTGSWAGRDGTVAAFDDAGWTYLVPRDGCIAFVRDEGAFVHFGGGAWHDGWPVPSLAIGGRTLLAAAPAAIAAPAGGAVIDIEARAAVAQLLAGLSAMGLVTVA